MKDKVVVILSGGLDSSTLLAYVKKTMGYDGIYNLSFKYGQRHSKELECAELQAKAFNTNWKMIDISFFKDVTKGASALTDDSIKVPTITEVLGNPQPITYVPFRNSMFLTIALAYAESVGATKVFYGAQAHDTYSGYWDASPEFLPKINAVAALNRKHIITVEAPFVNLKKNELLKIGVDLGVDYSKTWTCYNGLEKPCLTCPTCSDRIKSFLDIGVRDPLIDEETWNKRILKA